MRVTFVFEKRRDVASKSGKSCASDTTDCHWLLVQTHMSQPISDDDLTARVFGTALISPKPLRSTAADGSPRVSGSCGWASGPGSRLRARTP